MPTYEPMLPLSLAQLVARTRVTDIDTSDITSSQGGDPVPVIPPLVLDGGLSNVLSEGDDTSIPFNPQDTLWTSALLFSREGRSLIRRAHTLYLQAGVDITTTSHYQLSRAGVQGRKVVSPCGLASGVLREEEGPSEVKGDTWIQVCTWAWYQALYACWEHMCTTGGDNHVRIVAASLGPFGATLSDGSEYRGDYTLGEDELYQFHRQRIEDLVSTYQEAVCLVQQTRVYREASGRGCRVYPCFWFETIPLIREVEAGLRAHRDALAAVRDQADQSGESDGGVGGDIPVCVSMSCRNEEETCGGDAIEDIAPILQQYPQVLAVGINCTAPGHIRDLLRRLAAVVSVPLICYPNRGDRWNAQNCQWETGPGSMNIAKFTTHAQEWRTLGAGIIGGCCEIGPAHIRALRALYPRVK